MIPCEQHATRIPAMRQRDDLCVIYRDATAVALRVVLDAKVCEAGTVRVLAGGFEYRSTILRRRDAPPAQIFAWDNMTRSGADVSQGRCAAPLQRADGA